MTCICKPTRDPDVIADNQNCPVHSKPKSETPVEIEIVETQALHFTVPSGRAVYINGSEMVPKAEYESLQRELAELKDRFERMYQCCERFKTQRDAERAKSAALVKAIRDVLPVFSVPSDDFEQLRLTKFKTFNVHDLDSASMILQIALAEHDVGKGEG